MNEKKNLKLFENHKEIKIIWKNKLEFWKLFENWSFEN